MDAFGDESCSDAVISYGLLALPPEQVTKLADTIEAIKSGFDAPRTTRLHCREMFNSGPRSKSAWAHLNIDDVFTLYGQVARAVKQPWTRRIAGVAFKYELPMRLPSAPMKSVGGETGPITKNVPLRDKQVAVFCAWAALGQYAHNHGLDGLRFWADPDSAAIEWFDGHRQAVRAIGPLFFDSGSGQEPVSISPSLPTTRELPLLEIADLIAFVSRKTALGDRSRNGVRFKHLRSALGLTVARFGIAPNGGLGIKVENQ
jgi:hypothetical protein